MVSRGIRPKPHGGRTELARVLSSAAVRDYESHASGRPDLVFDLHRAVLADLGFEIRPESRILDLGCGDGRFVRFMRTRGLDAWGSDLSDGFSQTEADMIRSGDIDHARAEEIASMVMRTNAGKLYKLDLK